MNNAKLLLQSWQNAYLDNCGSSNPPMTYASWKQYRTFDVSNPKMVSLTIDPNATLAIFNGLRTTSISGSTEFQLTASPLQGGIYRFTWDSTGTNPAFRTARTVNLSTLSVAMQLNTNQTVTMTTTSGSFSNAQVGDTLFIPGITSGDTAGPFSSLNEGYWQILSIDNTSAILQLARFASDYFTGKTETVTPSSASQVQIFSVAGVQVGDKVDIVAGFSTAVIGTYTVSEVNPIWFEITTTLPLPVSATAVPGSNGMNFYSSAKRYLRIEGDQTFVAQLNGDTSSFNRTIPWAPGTGEAGVGEFVSTNTIYSLSIVNKSAVQLNVNILTVE